MIQHMENNNVNMTDMWLQDEGGIILTRDR